MDRRIWLPFLWVILFISIMHPVFAQDTDVKKESERLARKIRFYADEFFRIGDFQQALQAYQDVDSISPDNPVVKLKLGICNLELKNHERALGLLKSLSESEKAPEKSRYHLARAYHINGMFFEAIQQLELEQDFVMKQEKKDESYLEYINVLIERCENGIWLTQSEIPNIVIENLGPKVNSPQSDYAPLISRNENLLIFTSRRTHPNELPDPFSGESFEDIYYSIRFNNEWAKSEPIGENINSKGYHDAAVALSPDGSNLVVFKGGTAQLGARLVSNLMTSKRTPEGWSEPEMIEGKINSAYWEPSATISDDENTMIFSSNKPGGYGGMDLYMVKKLPNGQWAEPFNMGGRINTPSDEDGPFLHPDGNKLYFSSKGHNSMGGYDIFITEYDEALESWILPRNMGSPINTPEDDIYFVWSTDGERAYFSSEREDSQGKTDIYLLSRQDDHLADVYLNASLIESSDKVPMKAAIRIRDSFSNFIVHIVNTNAEDGKFDVVLKSGRKYLFEITPENQPTIYMDVLVPEFEEFQAYEKTYYIDKTVIRQ
ncbi:MAG TPA: hypothetical protein DDY13_07775 [Cytophagales bacterium]|jgi:tetratricopeptide (TPR) repeat protein|nr:hypothetical protein [Cytophagales bacterium]